MLISTIVNQFRRVVINTPFESLARRAYVALGKSQGIVYERELLRIMHRTLTTTSNCIDIGAYRGGVLQEIARLAPKGTHFAFEPVPAQYDYLKKAFPHVHVHQLALSDEVAAKTFYHVVSRPTYSGLQKVLYPSSHEKVNRIQVQTQLLDNVIPSHIPIHFIKVDVEGAEFHVFRGGVDTIRRNKPIIVFEHGLTSEYFFSKSSTELYDLLTEACGLHISLMEQWLHRGPSLTRQAFSDEVSIKKSFYFVAHP